MKGESHTETPAKSQDPVDWVFNMWQAGCAWKEVPARHHQEVQQVWSPALCKAKSGQFQAAQILHGSWIRPQEEADPAPCACPASSDRVLSP